jgi:hypothetical protein
MRKITTEEYLERVKSIHGNKYDYSKVEYINTRTKVILICKTHGAFEIKADNVLAGQGCGQCARDKHKLTYLSQERLDNLIDIHKNKYGYPDLNVVDGKIVIVCSQHGRFEQSLHQHEYGHGCPNCGRIKSNEIKTRRCKTCNLDLELENFAPRFKTCNSCLASTPEKTLIVCSKCGEEKATDFFYKSKLSHTGYRKECKACKAAVEKPYKKVYRQENKTIIRRKDLEYRKKRMEIDDLYKAKTIAREVIRKAISRGGYKKNSRTEQILGCDYETFKSHIESKFTEGMNWQNRGEWHVDHVVPISFAASEEQLLKLNHYTNLQPLWEAQNLEKSDKLN